MKAYYTAALGAALFTGTAVAFTRRTATSVVRRSCVAAYASPAEFAKSEIASNDVVVFSKSYCPFCTSTKQLFSSMSINAKVIELDQMDNGPDVQGALLDLSGQRTVPNVFIKGEHLGGNDDTQAAARSGKLEKMLGK
mmetsp:Transcript_41584/g.88605  ORF Transcript_41584/g.88605 Transcript_41584/m.88605 type:complete len:138 (-) Transcript_41584:86-499(-)|eukprot:CAMPEP_0172525928 /NCGR_PEP_ID=MMETSP1067-20121228/937_1 /TAXON_ID=265564 ORGANISM="Thalassiosira punctigera, Strain Tpunct2005C2" /NCGR_SAMPLE_ID=MMETSP1067 /ASSEMBLY_ACC=CAM_ASM_000444 /LENGTH=137 /DNA_ID=CAMNT_0013309319 /DNA_START=213 /DNA_END=626 /DNA_ORIENTATION=-